MKERTISQRNLLGAFVGGVLGILAFGFLNALLLPIGVFAGVIGGWWYQEIWAATSHGFNEGVARTRALGAFLFTPVRRLSEWRRELWKDQDDMWGAFAPILTFLALLTSPFIWLLRRPAVMVMWARSHPVNRAYLVRIATLPVFYAATSAIIGLLGFSLFRSVQGWDWNHDVRGLWVIGAILGVFMLGILTLMAPMMFWLNDSDRKLDKMRSFYRTWERYSSMGVAHFYVSELAFMARAWLSAVVWVSVCFAWFIGLGGVFLAIVGIVSAAIGFVKGVYQVSIKAGHWLCFGATLTTTIISAAVFHGSFGDLRILWIVALLTGVASAGVTEGLRRGFVLLFKTHRPARAVALLPLGRQLRPGGRLFWRTSTSVGDWFIRFLPVHPQMA
ncbi:MAG: hypothetical protein V4644_01545 [Patescibacteria group bacterium]